MRPTWPTHDWTVFDDEVEIGRIYEDAVATHTRWFWTLGGKAGQAFQLGLVGTGRAATVEEAVAACKMAYEQARAARLGFGIGLIYIPAMSSKRSARSELPRWRITRIRSTPAAESGIRRDRRPRERDRGSRPHLRHQRSRGSASGWRRGAFVDSGTQRRAGRNEWMGSL
jgi:hypothetical protein